MRMKRLCAAAFVCAAAVCLGGCAAKEDGAVTVYGFCGESEAVEIAGGVIVDTPKEDTFYGGEMRWKGDERGITGYTASYTLDGKTLLESAVVDETGGALDMNDSLGTIAGEGSLDGLTLAALDGRLLLTLETTAADGTADVIEIAIDVRQITLSGK